MLAFDAVLNAGEIALTGRPELAIASVKLSASVDDTKVTYSGGKGSAMKHFPADVATAFVVSVRPSVTPRGPAPPGTDLRGELFDTLVRKFYGSDVQHRALADLRRRCLALDPATVDQVVLVFPNELRRPRA